MAQSRLLVLVEGYPSKQNPYLLAFVHPRLIDYVGAGLDVTALSFRTDHSYQYDGISVVAPDDFERNDTVANYDVILSHAPNLRNHLRFILANRHRIKKLVLFIHGHEVLIKRNYYPAPYPHERTQWLRQAFDSWYDLVKVRLLGWFLRRWLAGGRTHLVFVSDWMKDRTLENLSLDRRLVENHSTVINNGVHPIFLGGGHRPSGQLADFVTIRPLDGSKYGIDIVCEIARRNPRNTFHLYGRGGYFNHHAIPPNLTWFDRFIRQRDIPGILDRYDCALMPTRLDSQGVSACEFASYGIPIYVSDLEVCREMLAGFENVRFFSNDRPEEFSQIVPFHAAPSSTAKLKFSPDNTTLREIELLRGLRPGLPPHGN
jgi:glycosyltransferase involved in cell wall biosynthesis